MKTFMQADKSGFYVAGRGSPQALGYWKLEEEMATWK